MNYNALIMKRLKADEYLANILDKSVSETEKGALEQARHITDGFTRLTWYSSCFFENYQDVCSTLSKEDLRFSRAVIQVFKKSDIILKLIHICVHHLFGSFSEKKMKDVNRELSLLGAHFSLSTFSNRTFAFSIATAIYSSQGIRTTISGKLTKFSVNSVTFLSMYSYVTIAAKAANWLKTRNYSCYIALYEIKIEMLFFLIEPKFRDITPESFSSKTAKEIASSIMDLLK